jgi:YVTN family beta-propeller protein
MERRTLGPLEVSDGDAQAPAPSRNGHGPPPLSTSSRRLRRRLGIAGAVLVLAGFVAAATGVGVPFGPQDGSGMAPLNTLVAIDARSGEALGKTPVGIDPQAVAVGDGSVWVANTTDRTVARVDPATVSLEDTVPIGVYPSDLVVGPRAVYVASGPLGQLVEIDPEASKAKEPVSAGSDCGGVEESIALAAGSLWLACDRTPAVVRIALPGGRAVPISQRTADTLNQPPASHFSSIAWRAGETWIADRAHARLIGLDGTSDREPRLIGVGTDPAAIALGFGSVWVANRADGTVSRVEPGAAGQAARVQTIPVGERPVGIAAGEGAVWVANAGSHTLSRIDPATNRVTRTVDLDNPPAGVATGAGRVWVTIAEE